MTINPKSLSNLKPAANKKDAVRVTLTLAPKTVALLKAQGNMSEAVDKLIELCCLGLVQHDGCLNPPLADLEELKSDSHCVHNVIEESKLSEPEVSPPYFTERLTADEMVHRDYVSRYQLSNLQGQTLRDRSGVTWWKVEINENNQYLLPLGSRAKVLYCK